MNCVRHISLQGMHLTRRGCKLIKFGGMAAWSWGKIQITHTYQDTSQQLELWVYTYRYRGASTLTVCMLKLTFIKHRSDQLMCAWRMNGSASFVPWSMENKHLPVKCCWVLAAMFCWSARSRVFLLLLMTKSQTFMLWLQTRKTFGVFI